MFRKSIVLNGAKYNEKRTWCEDLDFWFQLSKIGRLANIEKPLLKHCRSNLQSSIKHKKLMLKNTKKLLNMIWQEYKVEKKITRIRAVIMVNRDSQKGILIGHQGGKLKKVGTEARIDIEKFIDNKVFLELYVKVDKDWKGNDNKLKKYGYV